MQETSTPKDQSPWLHPPSAEAPPSIEEVRLVVDEILRRTREVFREAMKKRPPGW